MKQFNIVLFLYMTDTLTYSRFDIVRRMDTTIIFSQKQRYDSRQKKTEDQII